jgi:hypothetical protein
MKKRCKGSLDMKIKAAIDATMRRQKIKRKKKRGIQEILMIANLIEKLGFTIESDSEHGRNHCNAAFNIAITLIKFADIRHSNVVLAQYPKLLPHSGNLSNQL